MKTVALFCLLIAALLTGSITHAGSKYVVTEPLSDLQVTDRADFLKMQLVATGKLDDSWSDVKADSVEKREMADRNFWIVGYEDTQSGQNPQRIYLVLDALGELVTKTHSGSGVKIARVPGALFVP